MHVRHHHCVNELQRLQDHADRPAMVLKLRTIILARDGWTHQRIAAALGKSPRTIQQWIGDYNRSGLDGLRDRRKSNNRYLAHDQEQRLREHLDTMADDPHDGVRYAADLIPMIEQHFGVTYSLSGLYDLLHRLGYSWLMPRPRHEKNDPQAVAAFKKTPRHLCNRSSSNTLAKRSKSGSRTKHALDNKAH